MSQSEHRPYWFGPRDARGLVLGVRPTQAALVSAVAIVAVGLLRASGGPARVVLIVGDLIIGLSAAFVPVRGRPLGEWTPIAASYCFASISGRRREVATLPNRRGPRRPSAFAAFSVVEVDSRPGQMIGGILDRRHGTLTAGLVVAGMPFAVFDEPERERAVAGWASVLSSVGSSRFAPFRVQWIERTVPDRRQAMRDRVRMMFDVRPADDSIADAQASYAALVESESVGALRHEHVVALSVRARGRNSRSGVTEGRAQLAAALATLEERLVNVGIEVVGALTPAGVNGYLDRTFRDGGVDAPGDGSWPVACESSWSSFRTDAILHATYWIAEWPRSEVSSEFLLPLLHDSDGRRTVTVVMEPIGAARAVRRAEHARTSARADNEIRRRHGFSQTARTSRQHDAVIAREEELASGHAGFRFSGYVTVSASDASELERSCARVEQAGALARLELRRLFGSQDRAFCCTLPVGRGCG